MLKSVFSKSTAYLGVLTGVLGVISVVGSFFGVLGAAIIATSILTTVWVFFVGFRLCGLAKTSAS